MGPEREGQKAEWPEHARSPRTIRRWESGALAHAVSDPFGQGPLPWLRGSEHYFDDTGQVVPWYVDHAPQPGASTVATSIPSPRTGGPRTADDVHRQIKGFTSTGAAAPGEAIDFHITVDPPQQFSVDIYRIGHYGGDGASKIITSPRLSGIVQPPCSPRTVRSPATTGGCPGACRSRRSGTWARTWPSSPPSTATARTSPSRSATAGPPISSCSCRT